MLGEQRQLFQRTEGGIQFAVVIFFVQAADVLDEVGTGNVFGHLDRAFDFVNHDDSFGFLRLANIEVRMRPAAPPDIVGMQGQVQRVQLQPGILEPVTEFLHLAPVVVIHVLARTENFDGGDARIGNFLQRNVR